MNKTIGFIGGGNMASAIIGGILNSGLTSEDHIIATARTERTLLSLQERFQIRTTRSNPEAASLSDILFLAVKPHLFPEIIAEIRDSIPKHAILVSIAAGQSLDAIEGFFKKTVKLVRAMPNTPALVGEAMSALCPNENISQSELSEISSIFNSFGVCEIVPESMMDTVVGLFPPERGKSPVLLFLLPLADAAVADGMPRSQAYKFAAQAVLGSAKMVMETGKHPAELKDMVCSPAGTTIGGLRVLEQMGFRSAVFEAVKEAEEISRSL